MFANGGIFPFELQRFLQRFEKVQREDLVQTVGTSAFCAMASGEGLPVEQEARLKMNGQSIEIGVAKKLRVTFFVRAMPGQGAKVRCQWNIRVANRWTEQSVDRLGPAFANVHKENVIVGDIFGL